MLGDRKLSSYRLSSLFSMGSSDSQVSKPAKPSPVPSESGGRLTKVKKRLTSAAHLAPEYAPSPPAPTTRDVSLSNPAIHPVDGPATILESLEPPPSLDVSSRSSSPYNSRPSTPIADASSEGNLKKLRRKSRMFGGSQGSDGVIPDAAHAKPLAWIVGHQGKVPYNLAMLVNGEKVGWSDSTVWYRDC